VQEHSASVERLINKAALCNFTAIVAALSGEKNALESLTKGSTRGVVEPTETNSGSGRTFTMGEIKLLSQAMGKSMGQITTMLKSGWNPPLKVK
jgi:hypothetical protein